MARTILLLFLFFFGLVFVESTQSQQETNQIKAFWRQSLSPLNDLCEESIELLERQPMKGSTENATRIDPNFQNEEEMEGMEGMEEMVGLFYHFTPLLKMSYSFVVEPCRDLKLFESCFGDSLLVEGRCQVTFSDLSVGSDVKIFVQKEEEEEEEGQEEEEEEEETENIFTIEVISHSHPPNDKCSNAAPIVQNTIIDGTMIHASTDHLDLSSSSSSFLSDKPNLFYLFVAAETGFFVPQFSGDSELILTVLTSCFNVTSNSCQPSHLTGKCVLENPNLPLSKGESFYLMVEGRGNYSFSIEIFEVIKNVFFENAIEIIPGETISFSLERGPLIPYPFLNCSVPTSDSTYALYFKFSISESAYFNFSSDTIVELISGDNSSAFCIHASKKFLQNKNVISLFLLDPGEYLVKVRKRLADPSFSSSSFLSLSLPIIPEYGECDKARKIRGSQTYIYGTNLLVYPHKTDSPSSSSLTACQLSEKWDEFSLLNENGRRRGVFYEYQAPYAGAYRFKPKKCETNCSFLVQRGFCETNPRNCIGGEKVEGKGRQWLTDLVPVQFYLEKEEFLQIYVQTPGMTFYYFYLFSVPENVFCSRAKEIVSFKTPFHGSFDSFIERKLDKYAPCLYYFFEAKVDFYYFGFMDEKFVGDVFLLEGDCLEEREKEGVVYDDDGFVMRAPMKQNESAMLKICSVTTDNFLFTSGVVLMAKNVRCENARKLDVGNNALILHENWESQLFFQFHAKITGNYDFVCENRYQHLNFCDDDCICEEGFKCARTQYLKQNQIITFQLSTTKTNLSGEITITAPPLPPTPPPKQQFKISHFYVFLFSLILFGGMGVAIWFFVTRERKRERRKRRRRREGREGGEREDVFGERERNLEQFDERGEREEEEDEFEFGGVVGEFRSYREFEEEREAGREGEGEGEEEEEEEEEKEKEKESGGGGEFSSVVGGKERNGRGGFGHEIETFHVAD